METKPAETVPTDVKSKAKSRRSSPAAKKAVIPKKLEIVRAKNGYGMEIQFEGGGQLPKELKGFWLNREDAERAIRLYQVTKGK